MSLSYELVGYGKKEINRKKKKIGKNVDHEKHNATNLILGKLGENAASVKFGTERSIWASIPC